MNSDSKNIPYRTIDWSEIPRTEHRGETGVAWWRTVQFPGLRVRIVEYSEGYVADHWCRKGHIVHCLKGTMTSELENGETHVMKEGMTYVVSDELSSHRSIAKESVVLMIVDGDFLQYRED